MQFARTLFSTATLVCAFHLVFQGTPIFATCLWQGEADVEQEEVPVVSTESLKTEAPEVDDQFLRFEMWDGTVVSGIVSVDSIEVETEFGKLDIPINRLIEFRPGLTSLPQLKSKVDELVEKLGDREFKVRESAHRQLVAMGPILINMFDSLDDGGDAERKKHLVKIREEVQLAMDEEDDSGGESESIGVTVGDQVKTPDFGVIGKIRPNQFSVKSKFGDLTIQLADIKRTDRGVQQQSGSLRKTVAVAGDAFFQKEPISTRIRIRKGDKVRITASGIVQWTNWNQSSSPDGLPNQGNWNGISNGALCGRIGTDGAVFRVGSELSFSAKESGILYLGVAMRDSYAKNAGYKWTGKFKAKVKVEPTN